MAVQPSAPIQRIGHCLNAGPFGREKWPRDLFDGMQDSRLAAATVSVDEIQARPDLRLVTVRFRYAAQDHGAEWGHQRRAPCRCEVIGCHPRLGEGTGDVLSDLKLRGKDE